MIRDHCKKNDFEINEEHCDIGVSGSKGSRPGLDNMMERVRRGQVDTVVCYKLDRLGRSLKHLLDLLSEFKNKKVRLISVMDGLDTSNDSPMNRAFWQLLGIFAELEREMIRARVKDGLDRAKREGRFAGRPKGSKDKRKRSSSGYHLRYAGIDRGSRRLGKRQNKES